MSFRKAENCEGGCQDGEVSVLSRNALNCFEVSRGGDLLRVLARQQYQRSDSETTPAQIHVTRDGAVGNEATGVSISTICSRSNAPRRTKEP